MHCPTVAWTSFETIRVISLRLDQLVPRALELDDVDAAVGADERDVVLVEGEAVAPFQDAGVLAAEEPVFPADHLLDLVSVVFGFRTRLRSSATV
ncbi:hypothetical protein [Amycolatopsis sp. RTGN1]|uniref:hypothetical protein n=1 Tax=Amycolatopsis ponsaeliensis TaxID=2992142 RepID=UPI0025519ECA|nr:hypothetical protein [Amycolatopsis sp. RTGN1]